MSRVGEVGARPPAEIVDWLIFEIVKINQLDLFSKLGVCPPAEIIIIVSCLHLW